MYDVSATSVISLLKSTKLHVVYDMEYYTSCAGFDVIGLL
jgi:hypothetical protein